MIDKMIRVFAAALACGWLLTTAAPAGFGPATAWAGSAEFGAAQKLYDQSKFVEAIAVLQDALSAGAITGVESQQARELLARCQVKTGERTNARRTFLGILRQDPLYQTDASKVPPDEVEVYDEARKLFDAERDQARSRIPASLTVAFGLGSGDNKDFGKFVSSGGGSDTYDNSAFIAGSVRFPLRPRLSIDIELERFSASNADSFVGANRREYKITATPLAVSLYYLLARHPSWRASVFAGGGPMLQTTSSMDLGFIGSRLQIAETKVGSFVHAGIEAEFLMTPRFSLTGRVSGRSATASGYFKKSTLFDYTSTVPLKDRKVEFTGFGATVGLRAYIGY